MIVATPRRHSLQRDLTSNTSTSSPLFLRGSVARMYARHIRIHPKRTLDYTRARFEREKSDNRGYSTLPLAHPGQPRKALPAIWLAGSPSPWVVKIRTGPAAPCVFFSRPAPGRLRAGPCAAHRDARNRRNDCHNQARLGGLVSLAVLPGIRF